MRDDKAKFDVLLNTPGQIAQQYGQWYRKILDNPGVPWGIPSIDNKVIPARPGDLIGLAARPGNGKSSLMAYLARAESKRILGRTEKDPKNNEVVVYITWESSAEEIETFFMSDGEFSASDVSWGRVPYEAVARKLAKRASIPIWIIGHSIERAGQPMPRMTLPSVLNCIEHMERDYGKRPTLLLFDYLQLIPVQGAADRVSQVLESPPLIKELAQRVGVPAVCGVQASREVDTLKVKIPQKHHMQWGSSVEQAADKLFGLWRPWTTEQPDDEPIEIAPGQFAPIKPDLLVMQMLKQRGDDGRFTWGLHFAPQYLRLEELIARPRDEF